MKTLTQNASTKTNLAASSILQVAIVLTVLTVSSNSHAQLKIPNTVDRKNPVKPIYVKPTINKAFKVSTAKRTSFDPAKHGFNFSNTFQTELIVKDVRFGGLCGGMVYTSLDYFNSRRSIADQDYRPAVNTTLFRTIYSRQEKSILDNLDKWAELIVNPFGARNDEFFRWGLEGKPGGRLDELAKSIDAGRPTPLGLFKDGSGGMQPHHQVLAIGYDKGRYKGDLGPHQKDLKIFIYDPNYPKQTKTLVPDTNKKDFYYAENPGQRWKTYFVDKKYRHQTAPAVGPKNFPADGKAYELVLQIRTGDDDLRGGRDNVNATVRFKDGTSQVFNNLNAGGRWINNYCEYVCVRLTKPIHVSQIKSIDLTTTFGGGIGGDNWNMNSLKIRAIGGNVDRVLYNKSGTPLVRFDGNNRPFTAMRN